MGRILAIDYGRKRCGIAVTDELQLIAGALITVETHRLQDFLSKYFETEKVDTLVIGKPRTMNYTDSESEPYIASFIKQFGLRFPAIGIVRIDERFTSSMALQTMIDAGTSKKQRRNKATIDTISATIILQTYLEMKNNNTL
jgi:putative holliday junction resolvase